MNLAPLPRPDDGLARLRELVDGAETSPEPSQWSPDMEVTVGRRYFVPPERLEDNPNNARAIYPDDAVRALSESLLRIGQQEALKVYAPSQAHAPFRILEGHTRARAARHAGLRTVLVEVVAPPASGFDEYRQSRETNKRRLNVSLFDDALRLPARLGDEPQAQQVLAERIGETPVYVSKVLKVGRLPTTLIERMAKFGEAKFGLTMAHLVAQYYELCGIDRADRLVSRIAQENLSTKRVDALLEHERAKGSPQGPAVLGRKRNRPLSRAEVSGAARGELKLFPGGRLELQLEDIDTDLRDRLYASLVKAFEEAGLQVEAPGPTR